MNSPETMWEYNRAILRRLQGDGIGTSMRITYLDGSSQTFQIVGVFPDGLVAQGDGQIHSLPWSAVHGAKWLPRVSL